MSHHTSPLYRNSTPPLHRTPPYDPHNTPQYINPPPHNKPSHSKSVEEVKQADLSLAARIQMMQETMREIERNNERYRSRNRSSSHDLEARREEHRSTSAKMIGDPRIPCRSAFDSEQRRNLLAPPPPHSTDERFTEFQSEFRRSQATMINSMQATQAAMLVLINRLDQMNLRSSESHLPQSKPLSPRHEVPHQEHVLQRQLIPEVSLLASSIVQYPINPSEEVKENFVQQVQELQESDAAEVFDAIPQPTIQAVDDENKGTKSQETEATSKELPEPTSKINHLVLEIQDYATVFPAIDSEESSYFVEVDCKLELVIFTPVAAQWFHRIRKDGEEMERIGVG